MQLRITGHDLDITDALHQYIEKKLSKIEHKAHIIDMHVHLKISNKVHQEATIKINTKGHHLEAHATHKDMYTAIDDAVKRAANQLIKQKEKYTTH